MSTPVPGPGVAGVAGVDRIAELTARWLAARTSRRSFLARLARVAVFIATGPTLLALLERRAEARVCGQSGVTPRCDTFDCAGPGDVWGWCWYASPGCCANGGLKKICDCCTWNYPNVHGYCPSGTNVRCIVESCWADPRVMAVPLSALGTGAADAVELGLVLAGDAPGIWLAPEDPAGAAVVGPLAAAVGEPVVCTRPDRLDPRIIQAIQRRGTAVVRGVAGTVDGALAEAGRYTATDVVGATPGSARAELPVAAQAAASVMDRTGARRVLAVDDDETSRRIAPFAAALAGALGMPVVVGRPALEALHDARPPVVTWLIGPGAAGWVGQLAGAKIATAAGDVVTATHEMALRVLGVEPLGDAVVTLVPVRADGLHAAVAGLPGVALAHPDSPLGPRTTEVLRAHRGSFVRGVHLDAPGGLTSAGVWQVQSALNAFDTHQLVGGSGQGLPVIPQPLPERPIGEARVAPYRGAERPDPAPYWAARADPARQR